MIPFLCYFAEMNNHQTLFYLRLLTSNISTKQQKYSSPLWVTIPYLLLQKMGAENTSFIKYMRRLSVTHGFYCLNEYLILFPCALKRVYARYSEKDVPEQAVCPFQLPIQLIVCYLYGIEQ